MHENIHNYELITSQSNYSFKTRIDAEGFFNDFSINEDKLLSVKRSVSSFSESSPTVGCCVSGELDAEFLTDFDMTETQQRYRGKNIVWNQLWATWLPSKNITGWKGSYGVLASDGSRCVCDFHFDADYVRAVVGHKYYVRLETRDCTRIDAVGVHYGTGAIKAYPNLNNVTADVFVADTTSYGLVRVYNNDASKAGQECGLWYRIVLIDLTLAFGSGNEPSTVSEVQELFGKPYYPYRRTGVQMVYEPFALPKMAKLKVYTYAEAVISGQTVVSGDIPKGEYFIDTRALRKNWNDIDMLTVHCYDAMLKMEQPCYTEVPLVWNNVPMLTVLNHIADVTGVEVDSRTVINPAYIAEFPGVGEGAYTMREVLSMIGAAHAGNWIINDYGKLQLIPLKVSSTESNYLLDDYGGVPLTFGGTRILIRG